MLLKIVDFGTNRNFYDVFYKKITLKISNPQPSLKVIGKVNYLNRL